MVKLCRNFLIAAIIVSLIIPSIVISQSLTPKKLYNQASQQFWDGEYRRAESSYRKLLEDFSNSSFYWDARFGVGKSLFKQGKLSKAGDHFRAVRQNHPNSSVRADALFSLIEVSILRDQTIRARELLNTFLDVFPDHVLKSTAKKQLRLLNEVSNKSMTDFDTDADKASSSEGSPNNKNTSTSLPGQTPNQNPRLEPSSTQGETDAQDLIDPLNESDTDVSERQREMDGDDLDTDTQARSEISRDTSTTSIDKSSQQSDTDSPDRISPIIESSPAEDDMDTASDTSPQGELTPSNKKSGGDTGTPADTDLSMKETKETQMPANMANTTKSDSPIGSESPDTVQMSDTLEQPSSNEETNESDYGATLNQARVLYERANLQRAKDVIETVLNSGNTSSEAHFLAAKIHRELSSSQETVLDHLNRAIELNDSPPPEYYLTKASFLLNNNRVKEAQEPLNKIDPSGLEKTMAAKYYYFQGETSLEMDKSDQAFFHYMDSVRSAPSSTWANRSREIINNQL